MEKQRWQDWVTAIVGVWLMLSPWMLSYFVPESVPSGAISWNFYLAGLAAFFFGIAALVSYRLWEEWADIVVGIWLIASPWLLQFTAMPVAMWNAIIMGVIVVASAGWAISGERMTHA